MAGGSLSSVRDVVVVVGQDGGRRLPWSVLLYPRLGPMTQSAATKLKTAVAWPWTQLGHRRPR